MTAVASALWLFDVVCDSETINDVPLAPPLAGMSFYCMV